MGKEGYCSEEGQEEGYVCLLRTAIVKVQYSVCVCVNFEGFGAESRIDDDTVFAFFI